MKDEVQKEFIRSFVSFLTKEVTSGLLSPESQESVEVAVQCLKAAYDLDEDENLTEQPVTASEQSTTQAAAGGGNEQSGAGSSHSKKEVDLFDMFQSLYIERNPESLKMAENIKNEGNRLMKEGKYNEALLYYNRAITFDPKNPIFYCNRAAAYVRLNDNERAVTDCKSALAYNPNYSKAYGRLGIAYSNIGKYDDAQQAYAKAIELEPDNQDYRNNFEVARNARTQSHADAIPYLTEGLNAMLSNPTIRNLFSSAEIDLGQLQNLSQNPMVMNMIGQMFAGMQGGNADNGGGVGGGGGGGAVPPMPNDMLQLFQTFAAQLANSTGGNNQQPGTGDDSGRQPQPPPSS